MNWALVEVHDNHSDVSFDYSDGVDMIYINWPEVMGEEDYAMDVKDMVKGSALPLEERQRIISYIDELWSEDILLVGNEEGSLELMNPDEEDLS